MRRKTLEEIARHVGALALVALCLSCGAAWAGAGADALALLEKLKPGMTYEEVEELLAPAADSHAVGGDAALVRRAWLHGDFGVEIYFLHGKAYRIDVMSSFSHEIDALRAMDELLQIGRRRYGSVPRFDTSLGEYYWIDGPYRLSYAKAGPYDVRASRRAAQ